MARSRAMKRRCDGNRAPCPTIASNRTLACCNGSVPLPAANRLAGSREDGAGAAGRSRTHGLRSGDPQRRRRPRRRTRAVIASSPSTEHSRGQFSRTGPTLRARAPRRWLAVPDSVVTAHTRGRAGYYLSWPSHPLMGTVTPRCPFSRGTGDRHVAPELVPQAMSLVIPTMGPRRISLRVFNFDHVGTDVAQPHPGDWSGIHRANTRMPFNGAL